MNYHTQLLIGALAGLYGTISGVLGSYRAAKNEKQRRISVDTGVLFIALGAGLFLLLW